MGWRDFPGGPVVKTPHFHCQGLRFSSWLGTWDPASSAAKEKYRFPTPISSTVNTWPQCSMFVTIDDPTLTQNYSVKPTVFTRTHSLCCTSYGFWNKHNVQYPHSRNIQNNFLAPKVPRHLPVHLFPLPRNPGHYWFFFNVSSFAFSRMSYGGGDTVYNHLRSPALFLFKYIWNIYLLLLSLKKCSFHIRV